MLPAKYETLSFVMIHVGRIAWVCVGVRGIGKQSQRACVCARGAADLHLP